MRSRCLSWGRCMWTPGVVGGWGSSVGWWGRTGCCGRWVVGGSGRRIRGVCGWRVWVSGWARGTPVAMRGVGVRCCERGVCVGSLVVAGANSVGWRVCWAGVRGAGAGDVPGRGVRGGSGVGYGAECDVCVGCVRVVVAGVGVAVAGWGGVAPRGSVGSGPVPLSVCGSGVAPGADAGAGLCGPVAGVGGGRGGAGGGSFPVEGGAGVVGGVRGRGLRVRPVGVGGSAVARA